MVYYYCEIMGRIRIVKVSEEEYEKLKKAREELLRKGIDRLPDEIKAEAEGCSRAGDFALGVLVGLGAATLIWLLTKASEEEKD